MLEVELKRGDRPLQAVWRFAGWQDTGLLQSWREFLGPDSPLDMRDAADFARQAVNRWYAYADERLIATSLDDVSSKVRNSPTDEFASLLVLDADWRPGTDRTLAFGYFRRTWCGGLYLEFMAAHPLAEALQIRGILRATLNCLGKIATVATCQWVWWDILLARLRSFLPLTKKNRVDETDGTQPSVGNILLEAGSVPYL